MGLTQFSWISNASILISKRQHIESYFNRPNCELKYCRFHLAQSWFRRIQTSQSLLREKYNKSKNDIGKWLKCFSALALFLPDLISDVFTELMAIAAADDEAVADCIGDTYVEEKAAKFHPNL